MIKEKLLELIQQGEGQRLEFKVSYAKDISEEICAFANTDGGILLIGVTDNGIIKGCHYDNTKASQIQNTLAKIQPRLRLEVEKIEVDGKAVVAIHCPAPKAEKRVFMISGQLFIRDGASSEKLTSPEEVTKFLQHANAIHFDEAISSRFDYARDFNQSEYDQFLELSGINSRNDPLMILSNLDLVTTGNTFKNAAVLLFANDLQGIYHHAKIRCVQFKGITKVNILDDQFISGTIYEQFHHCMRYLKRNLKTSYKIETAGPREEILEIPEVVLREALLNSLAHRNYYETGACIMVEIYDDRVEVTNPGGLVPSISKNDFGKISVSRNPLLFTMLQRMRLVEQIGTGIGRMRQAMIDQGLPEPEFSYEGMFIVKLFRPVEFDRWINRWDTKLNQNQIRILAGINDDPGISIVKLSKDLDISTTTIEKHLERLKSMSVLKRVGPPKTGKWLINKINP